MRAAKALIRLGRCPGWSESLLGAHATLLVLSWGGSNASNTMQIWYFTLEKFKCFTRPATWGTCNHAQIFSFATCSHQGQFMASCLSRHKLQHVTRNVVNVWQDLKTTELSLSARPMDWAGPNLGRSSKAAMLSFVPYVWHLNCLHVHETCFPGLLSLIIVSSKNSAGLAKLTNLKREWSIHLQLTNKPLMY